MPPPKIDDFQLKLADLERAIMPLTTPEIEWIKLISEKIASSVNESVLKAHVETCPYGKNLKKYFYISIGICIGAGILGGATTGTILAGIIKKIILGQ